MNNRLIEVLKHDDMRLAWWSGSVADWNSPTSTAIEQRLHADRSVPGWLCCCISGKIPLRRWSNFSPPITGYHYDTFTAVTGR